LGVDGRMRKIEETGDTPKNRGFSEYYESAYPAPIIFECPLISPDFWVTEGERTVW
jgi:hypothetical protein